MELVDTTMLVQTPERVAFRYRIAGPGLRAAAWVLDTLVQIVLVMLMSLALIGGGVVLGDTLAGAGIGLTLAMIFFVSWFYGAFFEWWWAGQTPGKLVFGIRSVKFDGAPLGWKDAVLRNLLRGVDGLPTLYAVGGLVAMWDVHLRRIGDMAAGTVVVSERDVMLLGDVPIEPPVTEEERMLLPPKVILHREERRVIEQLLRRVRMLAPERAEELASDLGPTVSRRTGVQADTWLRVLTLAYARAVGRER